MTKLKPFLIALFLLVGVGNCYGAISFDAVSVGEVDSNAELTISHTVANQSNRLLIVQVTQEGSPSTVSSITYNGDALTQVDTQLFETNNDRVDQWYLLAPDVGTYNVVITLASAPSGMVGAAMSFYGVKQQAYEAKNKNAGGSTSPTVNVTTLTDNAWVIDAVGNNVSTVAWTAGAGQTSIHTQKNTGLCASAASYEPQANHGATTMSWTATGGQTFGIVASAWEVYVASASIALTGTVTSSITEADIVTGGKTIILTLTGDTWVATVGADNAITTALISGIDSAQSEANGWDAVVKANMVYTDVTRTSDTVVTITLGAEATYNITATETITATIPASALTGAAELVASPTFTVSAVSGRRIIMIN